VLEDVEISIQTQDERYMCALWVPEDEDVDMVIEMQIKTF